jgi:hypothetical protein
VNRKAKAEHRKLINDTIGQLLMLISQKGAYETLLEQVEEPSSAISSRCWRHTLALQYQPTEKRQPANPECWRPTKHTKHTNEIIESGNSRMVTCV